MAGVMHVEFHQTANEKCLPVAKILPARKYMPLPQKAHAQQAYAVEGIPTQTTRVLPVYAALDYRRGEMPSQKVESSHLPASRMRLILKLDVLQNVCKMMAIVLVLNRC